MKKIVVIALFFLATTSFAQGNLQFNQVINQNLTGTLPNTGTSAPEYTFQTLVITVPVGKVWKIESSSCHTVSGSSGNETKLAGTSSIDNIVLFLDHDVLSYAYNTNASLSLVSSTNLPLWLPSGSYSLKLIGKCQTQYVSYSAYGSLHAIEFNIIP
jgi:hypothetical protein